MLDRKAIALISKYRALGYTQREIADKLNISQNTVAYHLRKLRERAKKEGDDKVFNKIIYNLIEDRFSSLSKILLFLSLYGD